MFQEIEIKQGHLTLKGHLLTKEDSLGWIIFAHGSGSSHKSMRNNWVASQLLKRGFSTLLFDLLTEEEDAIYSNRFNIPVLAQRLHVATEWLMKSSYYKKLPIGYFGASTGAAAALIAAAKAGPEWPLFAVVSRGGRPDMAAAALSDVLLPTLFIVGSLDHDVILLNEEAEKHLIHSKMAIVPGATHLFEEFGTLDEVVRLAGDWFVEHLQDPFQYKKTVQPHENKKDVGPLSL
jgi:putative phosphoribosyl transferase